MARLLRTAALLLANLFVVAPTLAQGQGPLHSGTVADCPVPGEGEKLYRQRQYEAALKLVQEAIRKAESLGKQDPCLARLYVASAFLPLSWDFRTNTIGIYVKHVMPAPRAYAVGDFAIVAHLGIAPRWGMPYVGAVRGDRFDNLIRADKLLLRSLAIFAATGDKDAWFETALNLGAARFGARRFDKSIEVLERLLTLRESEVGPDHHDLVPLLNILSLVQRERGSIEDARRYSLRSVTILSAQKRYEAKVWLASRYLLATLFKKQERFAEAEALVAECIAKYPLDPKYGYPKYFEEVYTTHAELLVKLGRENEAKKQRKLALELKKKRPPDLVQLPTIVLR